MTLLSGWALAGLVLLAPLVIAHLRREHRPVYEVPSLLLWQDLERRAGTQTRRMRVPRLPLLLLLQALALVLLVIALARPTAAAAPPAPAHVYVLDDSLWMGATGRLAVAEGQIERSAARLHGNARVRIVLADGLPHVLYRGTANGVRGALRRVTAGTAPSTLGGAIQLAAGLLTSPHDRITVVHAPEDPLPRVQAPAGGVSGITVGGPLTDQGIFSPSARCGIGAPSSCEVLATVSNSGPVAVTDRYTAYANGAPALHGAVHVGARASAEITLAARPDDQVSLRLDVTDSLPVDDQAWVTVPGPASAPAAETVTLVGVPSDAQALARALAAVPGVTLRLRTPGQYRPADGRQSGLTVLDGWVPATGLPPSPSVLLVDPPRIPGGAVGGPMQDSVVSGTDQTSDLLNGVDLTSLSIDQRSAHRVTLPAYMDAVAWSPDGPLLAAGDDGSQRVAVLAFDPSQSDLPQLGSFPVLAANLVTWAAQWAPLSATAGSAVAIDATPGAHRIAVTRDGQTVLSEPLDSSTAAPILRQPGLYTIRETGAGVDRTATVPVSVAAPSTAQTAASPIDLSVAAVTPAASHGPSYTPWLLAAALLVLVAEWVYWRTRLPRMARA